MPTATRLCGCLGLIVLSAIGTLAQSAPRPSTATSTPGAQISGTVNVDGKPASGITLLLVSQDDPTVPLAQSFDMGLSAKQVSVRTVTDSQGHYEFHDLAPASYAVFPLAPVLADQLVSSEPPTPGKTLNVQAGEANVDGNPAAGFAVALIGAGDTKLRPQVNSELSFNLSAGMDQVLTRTTTNSQGRYHLVNIPPGSYVVFPFGPTLGIPPIQLGLSKLGKTVAIEAGEQIDSIDFSFPKGGVITGKVTLANGQPAIDLPVTITQKDQDGGDVEMATGRFRGPTSTDDRGIYRAFGLNPGRYTICTQPHQESGYSPAAKFCYKTDNDAPEATRVTVSSGQEATGIDIAFGPAPATYEASGQALDDDGNPVPGAVYYYYTLSPERFRTGGPILDRSVVTGADGSFRIRGLAPGTYGIALSFDSDATTYSDASVFDVADSNVSGLLIRVHRAASVAGVVTVQGNRDQNSIGALPQLQVFSAGNDGARIDSPQVVDVAAGGSFQVTGLSPGTLGIRLAQSSGPQPFSLIGIERDGVLSGPIELSAGEQVTGITVTLAYGVGIIRGQVNVPGGTVPEATQLMVWAHPMSPDMFGALRNAMVDSLGRFEIDVLPDGEYQMSVSMRTLAGWQSQKGPVVNVSEGQAPNLVLTFQASK